MKIRAHVRIARQRSGRPKIVASVRPSSAPLYETTGNLNPLPTLAFAVEFVVPDEAFAEAQRVIATVTVEAPEIAATVTQVR